MEIWNPKWGRSNKQFHGQCQPISFFPASFPLISAQDYLPTNLGSQCNTVIGNSTHRQHSIKILHLGGVIDTKSVIKILLGDVSITSEKLNDFDTRILHCYRSNVGEEKKFTGSWIANRRPQRGLTSSSSSPHQWFGDEFFSHEQIGGEESSEFTLDVGSVVNVNEEVRGRERVGPFPPLSPVHPPCRLSELPYQ